MRRWQKERARQEFGHILCAFSLALALEVWLKTKSWPFALLTFLGPLILIFTIKGIRRYFRRKALLESGIEVIDTMTGVEFEELLLAHFRNLGYRGELTQTTGDYGADLVLQKDGTRVVVQAKRWRQVVGIESVQQVIGAIKYYAATKGMVVTNSVFTQNVVDLAQANSIELIDREKLIEMLRKSQQKDVASQHAERRESQLDEATGILPDEICPYCGKILVARSGKYGRFIGCSGYPGCRFTQQG